MDHQSIKYPKQIEIDHANLRAPFHGSGICAMAANNDEPLFFISYCPVVTGPVKRVLKGISMLQNAHRRSERNSLSTRAEPLNLTLMGPNLR
jgi:hypothetical protein